MIDMNSDTYRCVLLDVKIELAFESFDFLTELEDCFVALNNAPNCVNARLTKKHMYKFAVKWQVDTKLVDKHYDLLVQYFEGFLI